MELPAWLTAQLVVSAVVIGVVIHVILGATAYAIYWERKISAYIQDRIGPNRVGLDFGLPLLKFLRGMWGLGQSVADGIKLILKEDYASPRVDKALFTLAPGIIVIPALIGFAIIPWGGVWYLPEIPIPFTTLVIPGGDVLVAGAAINVGVVYLLAVAAVGVYGVTLGGYASNNKYSFLGGLRATAQMISYEIPLGLSLLSVLLIAGTLVPQQIIHYQFEHGWLILSQPLAAIMFFIAALAEANRAPFDNAEAEQELVGGYHTEYSAMRFGLFLLAEYAHLFTASAFFALLFLGGYHLPLGFLGDNHLLSPDNTTLLGVIAKLGVYAAKVVLLVTLMMLIRWTIPRLRYDQIMQIAWQGVIPISLFVVIVTSVLVYLGLTAWYIMLPANIAMLAVIAPLARSASAKGTLNKKTALYGSRFSPMPGERVRTAAPGGFAREDRPVESTIAPTI